MHNIKMMLSWSLAFIALLLLIVNISGIGCTYAYAVTTYSVVIEDDADLLSDEDENEILEVMEMLTTYGNVGIKTINANSYGNAKYYGDLYYDELFGAVSDGTLLLIDMDTREIVLTSEGRIKKDVNNVMADTIMDNVYRYATKGDYKNCCIKTFEQVYNLVEGRRIAQPMKHICNLLFSAILAILINYGIVMGYTRKIRGKVNVDYSRLTDSEDIVNFGKPILLDKMPKEFAVSYESSSSRSRSYSSSHSSSSHSSHSSSSSRSSSRSSSSSRSHSSSHSSGSHRF